MLTYSFEATSLVARTFLRFRVCKSYTVMTAWGKKERDGEKNGVSASPSFVYYVAER